MGSVKKLAGQTAIYGLSSIGGRILQFLLVPLYVRVLTPSDYGTYTELFAWFTILNIIYTFGFETAFFRFANKEENPRKVFNTSFVALLTLSFLFSSLMYLFRKPIAINLDLKGQEVFVIWMALILAFDTLAVIPYSILRYQERPIKFSSIRVANILVNICLNLFYFLVLPALIRSDNSTIQGFGNIFYVEGYGVEYVFIANLIASAATLVLLSGELKLIRLKADMSLMKSMLRFSWPLLIVGLAGMLNETFDRMAMRHLLPYSHEVNKQMLGIYGANVKLAIFMILVVQAFRYAAEPFFFSQARKNKDAKSVYADVMKYFVIFGLIIFLGVLFYIDILKYFIGARGSSYHKGLIIVPLLLMANLFLGIYYNLSIWYKLQDKTMFGAVISIIGAVVTISANVVFVPENGYIAAAWAKLVCYVVMVVLSYYFGQKYYRVDYPIARILFYFSIAMFLYFVSYWTGTYLLPDNKILLLTINTLLLAIFIFIAAKKEKVSFHLKSSFNQPTQE